VTFVIDGAAKAPVDLDAGGTARYATSFDAAGIHGVSAAYSPSAGSRFAGSEGTVPVTVTAAKWATRSALAIDPDPTVAWQPATLLATVTNTDPNAPDLTGTVQFAEAGGTPIGDPVPVDAAGPAQLDARAGAGASVVRARYSGDSLHDPSAAAVGRRVTRDTTTTSIASPADPATAGKPFVIGVAVGADAPSKGIPTGDVQFSIDGVDIGHRVALDGQGRAFVAVTVAKAGSGVIGVRYGGDRDYLPSEGRVTKAVVDGGNPATPASPATVSGPLTRADLLAALHIQRVIPAVRRGAFRVGTVHSPRVRSLAVDVFARQAAPARQSANAKPRSVLVGRGRLSGSVIRARLTPAGRTLLKVAKRVQVRLELRVVDDIGNPVKASMPRTLRPATTR
jgi:hypothetical protein